MNLNENPTIEQLKSIFMSVDDNEGTHVLWVDINGEVRLNVRTATQFNPLQEPIKSSAKLRFEGWQRGNEYTGPKAAGDNEWMQRVFNALIKNWERPPRMGYVGDF